MYIRAIKWISRSGPLIGVSRGFTSTPAYYPLLPLHLQSLRRATTDTNPRGNPRAPTSTGKHADVSTCLPVTDCSGAVDREDGTSFSFVSLFSARERFSSFASYNTDPILLPCTHRFLPPLPLPSLSFLWRGTNPINPPLPIILLSRSFPLSSSFSRFRRSTIASTGEKGSL